MHSHTISRPFQTSSKSYFFCALCLLLSILPQLMAHFKTFNTSGFYPNSAKAQVVKGYVCGAETGRVYLRSQPNSSSQNANRTLPNGSPVWFSQFRNGFLYVESNIGNGWITERYICYDTAPTEYSSSYICGA